MSNQSSVHFLDNFKLIRPLGQGAFGEVMLAEDPKKRPVALKFLKIEAGQEKFIEHFKQEFALLAELRHRHLARVFDFGLAPEGNRYFFTEELCQGKTFIEALAGKPVSFFEEALVQVLSALDYIHGMGVAHFDIKAENVLVAEENGKPEVKILDFGIAVRLTSLPKVFGGTPRYMAPEVIARNKNVDHRADIYSLGILCFASLTGQFPFAAKTLDEVVQWHRTGKIDPQLWEKKKIPRYLRDLIEKMLEKNPADRFSTAGVAIRFLNRTTGNRFQKEEEKIQGRLPSEGPLVGRKKVLEEIKKRLDQPSQSSPVFLVRGERGSGKRRLLTEAKRMAELMETRIFEMHCDRLKPAWDEMAAGLGLPPLPADNPDEAWQTKVRADLLLQESKKSFLCLFIGNFERADRPFKLVIEELRKARTPLFVMAAEEGEGPGDVTLGRLTESEILQYIERVLGPIDRLESTANLLHRYSGGLPFLMAEGLGFMAPHIFRGEPLQKLLPPPGTSFLYEEKINSLPENSRLVLEWASLLFRPSTSEELATIAKTSSAEIFARMEPCVRLGLMTRPPDGDRYEVASQALALDLIHRMESGRKKNNHLQIGAGLEKAGGSNFRELGYHWATGGDLEKGKNYYKKAAAELKSKGDFSEAANYFSKSIPLASAGTGEHQDLVAEAVTLLTLTGNYTAAEKTLAELKEDSARRESLCGFLALKQKNYTKAVQSYQKAAALYPETDIEKIRCENALGNIALQQGDLSAAEELFRKTLQEEQKFSAEERGKISNNALGIVLARQGKIEDSVSFYRERLSLLAAGQESQKISLLSSLGYVLIQGSRFAEAGATLSEARELARTRGEIHALFPILGNLITAFHKESRYAEAITVLNEMIPLQERLGSPRDLANNLLRQGDIYHVLGMEEPARDCFKKGRELAKKIGEENLAAWFTLMESYCERQYGSQDRAWQMLEEAAKQGEMGKDTPLTLWARYGLGDLALQMGKNKEAHQFLESVKTEGTDAEFQVRVALLAAWLTPLDRIKAVGAQFEAMEKACLKNHYTELLWEVYHAWGKMEFAAKNRQRAQIILGRGATLLREIASGLPEEYRDRYLKQPERYRLIADFRKISGGAAPKKAAVVTAPRKSGAGLDKTEISK